MILTFFPGHDKNASFKQEWYIFPTNTSFDKMKAHFWKCSKIDLNGNYSALENRVLVVAQIKSQSAAPAMRGLPGLSMLERIQELLIRLVVGMHIAFIVVENSVF